MTQHIRTESLGLPDVGGPAQPLLIVRDLKKHFPVRSGLMGKAEKVHAVDGVSFRIGKGETLGIVGESGCGKSTTTRLLLDLTRRDAGEIIFDGRGLGGGRDGISLKELRRGMQMVFQDSSTSLNPRARILDIVMFPLRAAGVDRTKARDRASMLLDRVGLHPQAFGHRFAHELSGGQRQRVNIARALATAPRLVILDEAVSALDKSVEADVLNLLADLKAEEGLTYLFISHDLGVVREVSDRVMVMYLGQIAEIGPAETIYDRPGHPYTRALLAAVPSLDPAKQIAEPPLKGDPPNPINPEPGCRFRARCPYAEGVCKAIDPAPVPVGEVEISCHMCNRASGHSQAADWLDALTKETADA
ncbi:ABC transporter ATP-binding protein [Salipiger bermudensis]|uniref:Glutathione import ATP-binding protein GsiA n=1 Tax=Salipiger bermudensis (strain DSM 26914 / JCM 13377 / KCTC 12554 / HTCC2601) TaxID=314265 RepID=Q0FUR9_SALBH|nr:oligopeptide/dipeptide ABC transporter ATP-binding protein [Salipiger bermudensis]EAU48012.1 putative oligopeptide ABC transporter, ATP-binding component [Salipiger bermudensis HTCC2601]MAE89658.1 dipeptide/oligopeptide/nickel ABC transporter ATP-binding protein [Pelagibaca sp.]MCA1287214.1 ATP-binding cassette domain-containing protein [Salipiger bermudensis]